MHYKNGLLHLKRYTHFCSLLVILSAHLVPDGSPDDVLSRRDPIEEDVGHGIPVAVPLQVEPWQEVEGGHVGGVHVHPGGQVHLLLVPQILGIPPQGQKGCGRAPAGVGSWHKGIKMGDFAFGFVTHNLSGLSYNTFSKKNENSS